MFNVYDVAALWHNKL